MAKQTIRFTPGEAEVLNHRLETPDCIAEVWGPDNDHVWPELAAESNHPDLLAREFEQLGTESLERLFLAFRKV